ncbi:methyltransferase domain-containing protein [Kitasatospora cystarginea]|uniref:Methyltransferase domain-containing protein n=1 Tax=Kitasatospora cystarginea TaxID=58350 RepID=A0ABN3E997_9ACTN
MAIDGRTTESGYLLDNRQREAGRRFEALAEIFDGWTFDHLDRIGLTEGWCCWEVGAGGPGVPAGLARRVGPAGRVLATDLDTSWLSEPLPAQVEVVRHDVVRDAPPAGPFDLVHARLVLVHLADRAEVLRRLVGALRPGGWLVIEDADPALQPLACPDQRGPAEELANRIRAAFRTLLAQRGVDLGYGRTLPRVLREAGLVDVQAEGYFPVTSPVGRELEAATVRQIRGQLIEQCLVEEHEIDTHLANLQGDGLDVTTAPLITAWGRRPV